MKTQTKKIKHCPKCHKYTLVDVAVGPVKINPFTLRSYTSVQCSSCRWEQKKKYVFKDAEEEGKGSQVIFGIMEIRHDNENYYKE
jgi:hypothetical protein